MTISSTTNRVSYTGNGATTAFAVTYPFLLAADLKVYKDGTLQTITTHYTVSGGSGSTGTVTFVTAPANGVAIVILRDPAMTQGLDLVENDPLPAEELEKAYDKLTMLVQRLSDKINQAPLIANNEQFSGSLPTATARASKYFTFDANGNPTVSDGSDIEALAVRAEAAQVAAEAAQAAAELAETNAETAETNAETAETNAELAETNAEAAQAAAEAALSSINTNLQQLSPTYNQFSGTGAQTAFTLSVAPVSENVIDVYISGVYQQKSEYSVVGTTLTFSTAPPSGTNNVEVKIAPNTAFVAPANVDWGSITSTATVFEDYGSLA